MKCPLCGAECGLNPFTICQACGNVLPHEDENPTPKPRADDGH